MRESSPWRYRVLLAIAAGSVLAMVLHKPIPQDAGYHAFVDRRTGFGIRNFWNVISNVPFLLVGVAGLRAVRKGFQPLYPAYAMFFLGLILVCFGSSYYHLAPDNSTLTWDRLPMTLAFMAFVAIAVGEHISAALGRRCLPFLLMAGVASVIYWHVSQSRGHGDLRPYLMVQFLPLVLIPIVSILFPSSSPKRYFMWGMVAAYAAAKVFEVLDAGIYRASGLLSGHTLKHVTAAAGAYLLVLAVRTTKI